MVKYGERCYALYCTEPNAGLAFVRPCLLCDGVSLARLVPVRLIPPSAPQHRAHPPLFAQPTLPSLIFSSAVLPYSFRPVKVVSCLLALSPGARPGRRCAALEPSVDLSMCISMPLLPTIHLRFYFEGINC